MAYPPPTALVILDGFGYTAQTDNNPIAAAHKPIFDYLWRTYPHTLLKASGLAVGLPDGIVGNSEAGHITLGAGRIIQQDITRLNEAIDNGSFFTNPHLNNALGSLQSSGGALHLMGLVSDASVHSNLKQLNAYVQAAKNANIKDVYIHAFLDGRDSPAQSAMRYLAIIDEITKKLGIGTLVSLCGRFYAMDRDRNWQRIYDTYRMLTHEEKISFSSWQQVLNHYYALNISDEFIPPTQLTKNIIHDGDGIIFFNVRPDRARQLTAAFTQKDFNELPTKKLSLSFFLTPVEYGVPQSSTRALFPALHISSTLKQILISAGKTIFSIAETEKYAHITYFFDGGSDQYQPHEERVLIPSLKKKNYIQHPEMSADKITTAVLHSLDHNPRDFYLINFANADMVGHSGNFAATRKAIEIIDTQLGRLYDAFVIARNGTLFITGDHGNAEDKNQSDDSQTSHTTNPVPFIMVAKNLQHQPLPKNIQGLCDIAPLILTSMGIAIPDEMLK